jgi:cold shock CspA family protein
VATQAKPGFNINDPGSASRQYSSNQASTFGQGNGTTQSNNGPFQPGMGIRETGIIEKLLHSYGFIQCCDRQARLFFHFSQFEGNIEHLKIGDPVEFEMTYDRRTGKPIASAVSKIAPEVVMSEERVIGTVTTELKINPEGGHETQGRISYENRGECFFLPFNTTDVEGNVTLTSGDKVSFQMATVQRSGNLAAKTIRLENPAAPVKYRGVVNSLQDTFGFIERADVVKEIYFNIIDMQEGVKEDNSGIQLGDDVEFIIQTRAGKEVACNLIKLPPGTVVFEDIGTEWFRGQVLKPLDRSGKYQQTEALPGKVKFRAADRSEAEIPFGEKDQLGDFTLKHGDWIKFIVATDRRDKLKRATKIELLDESFSVSDERREQGVVQQLAQEGSGFIKCVDRSDKMMFNYSECLDVSRKPAVGDEVEFTTLQDPKQLLATRIKYLAPGTVMFDIIIAQNILGMVAEEPSQAAWNQQQPGSPTKPGSESPVKEGAGRIVYELNSVQLSIPVYAADCDARNPPHLGDKVQFNINQLKATKETNAMNVRVLEQANIELPSNTAGAADNNVAEITEVVSQSPTPPPPAVVQQVYLQQPASPPQLIQQQPQSSVSPQPTAVGIAVDESGEVSDASSSSPKEKKDATRLGTPQRGYVAALKDGFGFIETLQHDKEIFFHFSHVEGKADKLEVGLEVEYFVYSREKGGKVSAEGVKVLTKGSIPKNPVKEEMLYGKVARPLRSVNPDQADYCGLIVSKSEEGKILAEYQFGIASLLNKKELLQEGDPVNFQVSLNEPFAYNIKSNKQKLRSTVEAVKGQFGFLTYEQEEGKKLFFHMSEVEGGEVLQVGDQVEFVVVTNSRTKKHSACCVRKLGAMQRPERLISKLKALSMEEGTRGGPKLVVVRPPRGPDGTRGFAPARAKAEEHPPIDLMEQLTAQ